VGRLRSRGRAFDHGGRLPTKLAVEAVGAAIVGFGALATVAVFVLSVLGIRKRSYTEIRLFLGRYLALGLEFQLGADILSTAVGPTFAEIEILAAIVVIRTALNYFLSREIERERQEVEAAKRTEAASDPEYRDASA
jgi:uncharacterized membrane protein